MGRPFKGLHPQDKHPPSMGGQGGATHAHKGVNNGGRRSFWKATVKMPARRGAQTLGACRRRRPDEAK